MITRDRRLVAAAGVVVVVSAVLLLRLMAPMRWVFDDWIFITTRDHLTIDSVLRSHNGHPVMLPSLVFQLGFHTVGLHDLWFYRVALVLVHLALCSAVAARVWRRHGVVPAAAIWLLVCFMGAGATNLIWPFQISLVGSVLFFVLAMDALDRLRVSGSRRDRCWVAGLLTGSAMCSAVGLAAIAAVGLVVVVGKDRRRDWWTAALPAALFALWWSGYRESTPGTSDLALLRRAIWQAVQAAGAGILFGNHLVGGLFVVALFLAAAVAVAMRKVAVHQTVALLFVAVFWLLTASTRALQLVMLGLASPLRYQYIAIIGLLLGLSDLAPVAVRRVQSSVAGAVCMLVGITSVWAGYDTLIAQRDNFTAIGQKTAAELTVVDAHPDRFDGAQPLVRLLDETLLDVGSYLRASRNLDSRAGFTSEELRALPDGRAGSAEVLMLPLLAVDALPPDGCVDDGPAVTTLSLEAGETVDVTADVATSLIASRWMPPDPQFKGVHDLIVGSWTITAPADDLQPAWTLTFDHPVRPLDCG